MSNREFIGRYMQIVVIAIAAGVIVSYLVLSGNLFAAKSNNGNITSLGANASAKAADLFDSHPQTQPVSTDPVPSGSVTGSGSPIGTSTTSTKPGGTSPNAQFAANQNPNSNVESGNASTNKTTFSIGKPGNNGSSVKANIGTGNIGYSSKDNTQSVVLNIANFSPSMISVRDSTLSLISGQTKTVIGNVNTISSYLSGHSFSPSPNGSTYIIDVHDNTLSIISGQTKTVIGNSQFTSNIIKYVVLNVEESHPPAGHKITLSHLSSKAYSGVLVKIPTANSSIHYNPKSGSNDRTQLPRPPFVP